MPRSQHPHLEQRHYPAQFVLMSRSASSLVVRRAASPACPWRRRQRRLWRVPIWGAVSAHPSNATRQLYLRCRMVEGSKLITRPWPPSCSLAWSYFAVCWGRHGYVYAPRQLLRRLLAVRQSRLVLVGCCLVSFRSAALRSCCRWGWRRWSLRVRRTMRMRRRCGLRLGSSWRMRSCRSSCPLR